MSRSLIKCTFIPTNKEVGYSQIKEEVIALISEALIHDEGQNNQRVPDHHHDHQNYHEDRQNDHRVPGERSPIRADGRAVGARRIEAGNHCQIEDIWRTSNRSEVIM